MKIPPLVNIFFFIFLFHSCLLSQAILFAILMQSFTGQTDHRLLHQNMSTHPFRRQLRKFSICLIFLPREINGLGPSKVLLKPGNNPGLIAQVSSSLFIDCVYELNPSINISGHVLHFVDTC